MLTLCYHLQTLKWALPTAVMMGSSPSFLAVWACWRSVSAVLPKKVYCAGDDFLYSLYQKMVLFFFENYTGAEIIVYGDAEETFRKKENVIMICNHQSSMDWVVADMLAVRQGSIGHIRYIIKDGVKYLPLYGFYFRQHSCIYVKRSGKFQFEKTIQQLTQVANDKIPFWMVVFPEGTRYNKKTLKASQEFAEKNGLPATKHVLVPRYKAMQLSAKYLSERVDAIYDVTIAYSDTTHPESKKRIDAPSLSEFLAKDSPKIHLLVEKIGIKDVPQDEEKFKEWLYDRYARKDKILEKFYSASNPEIASFGDKGHRNKLSIMTTLPPVLFFTAINAPMLATAEGRSIFWKVAVLGTVAGWVWMTVRS